MTVARVGIVSWNTAELLDACLSALPAALGGLDAEVVVVDNASDDDSVQVAARYPFVRVVRNDMNVGYAVAMNQALSGTPVLFLVALNPDTVPTARSLERLVASLQEDPAAGLVVPRLLYPDGRLQHSVYRFPSILVSLLVCFLPRRLQRGWIGRRWWLEGAAQHDQPASVDWAIGAVHAMRADAVGIPPYSTRWFMYVEDLELCWRLGQAGWQVRLDPTVEVFHVGNAAGSQAWGSTRSARYWQATYDFLRMSRGPARTRALAMANTLGAVWVLGRRLVVDVVRRRPVGAFEQDLRRAIAVHARVAVGRA